MPKPVYLIDGCRSPIGRGHPGKGMYRDIRADELAVQTLKALITRVKLKPDLIDDFYLGCVGQHLEQGKNLARLVLLLARLPNTVPGVTINRLCASSFTALQMAADSIRAGTNRLVLTGGVEHLGHVPMTAALDYHPGLFKNSEFQWTNMGLTAEKLAQEYSISRREQDEYTLQSNRRHFQARENGAFEKEIVSILTPDNKSLRDDEGPRVSSMEQLASLKTPYNEGGTVTAASSSGISDGACMAVICDEENLKEFNQKALAKILTTVNIGLDPTVMGLGPVYAIKRLLERSGLSLDVIDLFEINEAFAVQVLVCQRELGIDNDRLNINGGAVALGHPLGMSGLRVVISLAHSMVDRNARYGIASLCVGHGQGVAMLLERN